jgi:glycosyltransferase involved in cell wall biosynthesis
MVPQGSSSRHSLGADVLVDRLGPDRMSSPAITVVIPTYNRCERLARLLSALDGQDMVPPFEVIVVSDGSTDGTVDLLRRARPDYPLVVVEQPNSGPATARNRGLELARGELIVFVDDDIVPAPNLLAAHAEAHRAAGPGTVVIGPMLDPPDHVMSAWVRWEQRMLAKQYAALEQGKYPATSRQFYTGNASVDKAALTAVGGFDPRYRRAEDVELAMRLDEQGSTFVFEGSAKGFHYAVRSYDGWRDIARSYGRLEMEFASDPARQWLRVLIAENFRGQHAAIRVLVRAAMRLPRLTDRAGGWARPFVEAFERTAARQVGQWLLSAVYAADYWRAAATAAGGPDALLALLADASRAERDFRADAR